MRVHSLSIKRQVDDRPVTASICPMLVQCHTPKELMLIRQTLKGAGSRIISAPVCWSYFTPVRRSGSDVVFYVLRVIPFKSVELGVDLINF